MQKSKNTVNSINKGIQHEIKITDYERTEFGLAQLFIDMHGDNIKCIVVANEFYLWNKEKGLWLKDNTQELNSKVETFLSVDLRSLANNLSNVEKRDSFLEYINKLQKNCVINNIIIGITRNSTIQVNMLEFDSKYIFFNGINKVYNTKNFKFYKHNRKMMLSKQSNICFDNSIENYVWRDFIMDIMGNDEELYTYILRIIAYAMKGKPDDDCMFILYGPKTRNGKSTFINGLLRFFGDYGTTIQPDTISKKSYGNAGAPRPDILRLQGKRFVNIAEASNNQKLDVAIIKALTGGDVITARQLYKDYEEFINNSVFFLHTNYLPIIDDNTVFKSNRIIVIPFEVEFKGRAVDLDMDKKLTNPDALSGLFNEIHRVNKEYEGISIKRQLPKRVKESIQNFYHKSDPIQWFLDDNTCTISATNYWLSTKKIYEAYKLWAPAHSAGIITAKALTMEIEKKGYKKKRRGNGNGFIGLKIK